MMIINDEIKQAVLTKVTGDSMSNIYAKRDFRLDSRLDSWTALDCGPADISTYFFN